MSLLKDKVALITGAGRGIGKAIAMRFASEGCDIAFTDIALNDVVMETEKELKAYGVRVKAYVSNAAVYDDAQQTVSAVLADFGHIDILVNNAGITRDGALKRMSEQDWDAVINVNLKSVFNFTKAIQPVMWRQGGGSVINMSSVVGVSGNADQCNYAASKAGIIGFTKSIAREIGSRKVRCNAIAPGLIETDMTKDLPDEIKEGMLRGVPLRRMGKAEEIANVALFLASDQSSYVTGQVIVCDGGM